MAVLIYLAVAALALWAVWYLARHIGDQLAGKGGCGDCPCRGTCSGSCPTGREDPRP